MSAIDKSPHKTRSGTLSDQHLAFRPMMKKLRSLSLKANSINLKTLTLESEVILQ
jgi:hypothetical protein